MVGGNQSLTVSCQRHFVEARPSARADRLLKGEFRGRVEVVDPQRTVAIAAVEPAAMACNAVGSRVVVIDAAATIEDDADEAADGALEFEIMGVNDIDARVRAVAQIVFAPFLIDEADVERAQPVARNDDSRHALGLSRERRIEGAWLGRHGPGWRQTIAKREAGKRT